MNAKKTEPLSTFQEMSQVAIDHELEFKNKLAYLAWARAWRIAKFKDPKVSYKVWRDPETHKPYTFDEFLGYMVYTEVTFNGETQPMHLPVLDFNNKAMRHIPYKAYNKDIAPATMSDINNSIMRCLVKNLALFGLGLHLWCNEMDGQYRGVISTDETAPVDVAPRQVPEGARPQIEEDINDVW